MEERRGEMKKNDLLKALRNNTVEQHPMPEIKINAITYEDKVAQFIKISEEVGGKVKQINKEDDLGEVVKALYPNAKTFASNIKEVQNIVQLNPDTVQEAQDLNGTDVAILAGEWGVAENGCIWVPQTMKEKAVCFISEELIITLHEQNIVNNMHEGYKKVCVPDSGYGCWISGPSKTADIEQSLVMGAQAAKSVTVLLIK